MSDDEDIVRTVYLTGQPGSGKTELARQYGEQFRNAISPSDSPKPLVITLNAKTEESLLKSIKEVIQKLQPCIGMEPVHHSLVVLLKQLRDYFCGYNGAWLLIIDDMFGNDFNHLFPRPGSNEWGGGQVLVTTQDSNLVQACHHSAKEFSLYEGMTKEDALALLKEISGVDVDDFAEEIIKEFKSLPLSLACCATYVGEVRQDRASTEFGWKEYLEMYRESECVQLESRTFCNNDVYPFPMAASTELAVRRMAETSDVLRLTFSILSYCALIPVPLNVLARYVKENLPINNDKQPTKENAIFKIQSEISRCTLLIHGRSQNVETIKCHQVIHRAFRSVQDTKPVKQQEIEFVKMMKSLNETLDFMDNTYKEDVLLKFLMRPHLKSFIDHANDMSWNDTAEFVLISMKNGQFLFSTSDMPNNLKALKSLELLQNIYLELDLSDQERCDILANLGFYYLELDRKEEALYFLNKAYDMTDGKSEYKWLLLRCRISFNLARTHNSMGRVDHAIDIMKTSIDLAKIVYVMKEDEIMNRFCWLAGFYLSWKKIWKLGTVVEEAIEFFSGCALESATLSRASCLHLLAHICCLGILESSIKIWKYQKYVNQAENFIKKSVSIYEQVLGADVYSSTQYCDLLLTSVLLKALVGTDLTEGRMQLEKAMKCCLQNGDKFTRSVIVAHKKHMFDSCSSRWRSFCYQVRNLARGRLIIAEGMNICDDILEDYHRGRTSPSRRIIRSIEKVKNVSVLYNWACILIFLILIIQFCNMIASFF